jgi:hypothetical protein
MIQNLIQNVEPIHSINNALQFEVYKDIEFNTTNSVGNEDFYNKITSNVWFPCVVLTRNQIMRNVFVHSKEKIQYE